MTDASGDIFSCPACGVRFALNRQVAARKIACKCGNIFRAPSLAQLLPDADPYDLVGGASNVEPPAARTDAHSIADAYPHRKPATPEIEEAEPEFSFIRDRLVPILLLAAGLLLRIWEIPADRGFTGASFKSAIVMVLFQMVLSVSLMLAGVLIASKILSVNFGALSSAILKLCGIAVFAWACGTLVVVMLQYNIRGFIVAFHVMLIIYSVAIWSLFSLELQEAMFTVAICALLEAAAGMVLFVGDK